VTPTLAEMTEASVNPVLLDGGYECVGEGVYRALWSTLDVEHFIYIFGDLGDLDDPERRDTLTGDFGIRNQVAEAFSCNAIHAYGGEIFRLFKCAEPTSCAMRFSFARLEPSRWPIPRRDFLGKEIAERFRGFIAGRLIPTIGRVVTLGDLLGLLVADMSYFPWIGSNGAIRAAQIVALAGQIGLGATNIRAMVESRKSLIARGGSKTSELRANPTGYIDRLLDDWAAGSSLEPRTSSQPQSG
jgi:hypothetical protein